MRLRKENTKKMSDLDLIILAKKSDRKAQVAIYDRYYLAMYNTAYRICNDEAEAEDVMQEAFLSAFRNLEQYSQKSTFGAWLKRIVVNTSLDAMSHKVNFHSLENIEMKDESSYNFDENKVELSVDGIKKCVLNLPDEQRIVLSLFLFEGYDHEEIANILGISHDAARARYSRAKKRLLKNIRDNKIVEVFSRS
jgi:RNA polymerase sigma-70 factor (ECF subfamily)